MSLRTSIILLSLAFGALVAVVVAGLLANAPSGKLQADLERLHAAPVAADAPAIALPDLRDAPKSQTCAKRFDQFRDDCRQAPMARPATITR
jgi:hypothetical protein